MWNDAGKRGKDQSLKKEPEKSRVKGANGAPKKEKKPRVGAKKTKILKGEDWGQNRKETPRLGKLQSNVAARAGGGNRGGKGWV